MSSSKERAIAYVDQIPGAISGQGGDKQTFIVACKVVQKFELDAEAAMEVMRHYNLRCQPQWAETELRHKVNSAMKQNTSEKHGYFPGKNSNGHPKFPSIGKLFRSVPPQVKRTLRTCSSNKSYRK